MIWKRFKKNKLALGGLIFMAISVLVSFFGFFIIPDHSPDVNTMYPDLAKQKPGFTCTYIKIKTSDVKVEPNIFIKLLIGWDKPFTQIPIDTFWQTKDSVYYKVFNT
ncbi:MAG: hypothetical protein ACKVQB_12160, partial [Bacteroidia bacterium]